MLQTLQKIFASGEIEINKDGTRIPLHSHTSMEQSEFLQKMLDIAKPVNSVEVGLAYGISTLSILEKLRALGNAPGSHIVIEPFPELWSGAAEHNIEKEGLTSYATIHYKRSDIVLPAMYAAQNRIQFAYIDTTKVFDIVLQDFYFIDKMMDVNGIIVMDDCDGYWPGIRRVARFISTLPHYKILEGHRPNPYSTKRKIAERFVKALVSLIPFKDKLFDTISFETAHDKGIDFGCIAFQKVAEDSRDWKWDKPF